VSPSASSRWARAEAGYYRDRVALLRAKHYHGISPRPSLSVV
jgi:hypothetical protein